MSKNSYVYLSGALAGAQDLAGRCDLYERFAGLAQDSGIQVYMPHTGAHPLKNSNLSPRKVFNLDMDMIRGSKLVVAFLDVPSLGVGAEVALACSLGVPVLGALPVHLQTSRFLEGLLDDHRGCGICKYRDLGDLASVVVSFLSYGEHFGSTSRATELPPRLGFGG